MELPNKNEIVPAQSVAKKIPTSLSPLFNTPVPQSPSTQITASLTPADIKTIMRKHFVSYMCARRDMGRRITDSEFDLLGDYTDYIARVARVEVVAATIATE